MRPARGFHGRDIGGTAGLRRISSSRSITSPYRSGAAQDVSDPPAVPNARRPRSFDALPRVRVIAPLPAGSIAGVSSTGTSLEPRVIRKRLPAPLDVLGEESGEPKACRQTSRRGPSRIHPGEELSPEHSMHAVIHRHFDRTDNAGDRPCLGIPRGRSDHRQGETHRVGEQLGEISRSRDRKAHPVPPGMPRGTGAGCGTRSRCPRAIPRSPPSSRLSGTFLRGRNPRRGNLSRRPARPSRPGPRGAGVSTCRRRTACRTSGRGGRRRGG